MGLGKDLKQMSLWKRSFGLLLFLLYINDLPLSRAPLLALISFIIFADGTNILISRENRVQLEILINIDLKKLSNCFKLNKLSLNIDKVTFMIFRKKYNINQHQMSILKLTINVLSTLLKQTIEKSI